MIYVQPLPEDTDTFERDVQFCHAIESVSKKFFPYKHNNFKAMQMLDLLENGLLFGAETFVEKYHIKFAKKKNRTQYSHLQKCSEWQIKHNKKDLIYQVLFFS